MWFRRRLYSQIDDYAHWRHQRSFVNANRHREYLYKFAKQTGAFDVTEITPEQVELFIESIRQSHTFYSSLDARKAVKGMLRYYKSKGYPCLQASSV